MAFVEIDDVAVNEKDYEAARAGDKEAVARIGRKVHNVRLYMHALDCEPDDIVVPLRELEHLGAIKGVIVVGATSAATVVQDDIALGRVKAG